MPRINLLGVSVTDEANPADLNGTEPRDAEQGAPLCHTMRID